MCGIAGIINVPLDKGQLANQRDHDRADALEAFKKLLYLSQLRGKDSSGTMFIDNIEGQGSCHVVKENITSATMLETKRYTAALNKLKWNHAIGHSRAATVGEVSYDTSHPHTVGPITLVHNGTMIGYGHHLKVDPSECHSDSHGFALALSRATVEGVTGVLDGIPEFGALVWWDERDKSLNIAKDKSRTLFWDKTNDTKPFICLSSQREAIVFTLVSDDKYVQAVPDNTHIKILPGGEVVELGGWSSYKAPQVTYTGFSNTRFGNSNTDNRGNVYNGKLDQIQSRVDNKIKQLPNTGKSLFDTTPFDTLVDSDPLPNTLHIIQVDRMVKVYTPSGSVLRTGYKDPVSGTVFQVEVDSLDCNKVEIRKLIKKGGKLKVIHKKDNRLFCETHWGFGCA